MAARPPARSIAVAWLGIASALAACAPRSDGAAPPPAPPARSAVDLMRGGDVAGFERALAPRRFDFPADHGPHSGFRSEWWYWTGNLTDARGRPFGYQLTLFRNALAPPGAARPSAWSATEVYLGHFAIADRRGGRFRSAERFARAALGLAGAGGAPPQIWVEDWRARVTGPDRFHLAAAADGFGLEVELAATKPVVLQGEGGLSQKGASPGNASYYYSLTRLATSGRLTLAGRELEVTGWSWMDREWSTAALEPEQSGWDWFALQLDDGSDLMFYRLRRRDGEPDRHSAGVLVGSGGEVGRLAAGDLVVRETAHWRSPATGVRYPSGWALELPAAELTLEVEPLIADQELRHRLSYWEGAVTARGRRGSRPVAGRGYVELVGYDGPRRESADYSAGSNRAAAAPAGSLKTQ